MKISRKVTLALTALLVLIFLAYLAFSRYLSLEQIKLHRAYLVGLAQQYPVLSVLIYIFIYALLVNLAIPEAGILTITGGLLFGAWKSTLYVTFAAMVGACMSFFIIRLYLRSYLEKYYGDHYFKAFNTAFTQHGVFYLLAMRLIPIFPFVMTNVLASLTNISFFTYFWTALVGILPITFIYSLAGEQLQTINSPSDIFSTRMIILFTVMGLFILAIGLGKQWLAKKYNHNRSTPTSDANPPIQQ